MKTFSGILCVFLGLITAVVLSQVILAWTNPLVQPGVGGGPISASLSGNVGIGMMSPSTESTHVGAVAGMTEFSILDNSYRSWQDCI